MENQPTEVGTYELLAVSTQPAVISAEQNFALVFSGYNLPQKFEGAYTIADSVNSTVVRPPPTSVPEDVGFRKRAEGEYVIDEFLVTGESVIIRWSEADQNFIIVDYN